MSDKQPVSGFGEDRGHSTRDRLVASALRLFWDKGFNSTSVADILRDSDTHSGSLYHFFATKQEVLVAVLDAYRTGIGPMLLEPSWSGIEDPIERIFALLAGYRRQLIESDFRHGCPIGNIALELHEPDPPVRRRVVENFEGWVRAVEGCIRDAAHRLPDDVDPRQLASFTLTTMEGAVMLARAYESIQPFDDAIGRLRDYYDRLVAAASG